MKVAASSDWRETMGFDTPVLVSQLLPGEPARCSICSPESPLRPRTELWAVKHRHPQHHSGHVRFYCSEHVPTIERRDPVARARPERREPRTPVRRAPAVERPRAICPDCFMEIPATDICGMCGKPAP